MPGKPKGKWNLHKHCRLMYNHSCIFFFFFYNWFILQIISNKVCWLKSGDSQAKMKVTMASNKEMRPTCEHNSSGEASSWEIIVFSSYLKKQHKSRDKGYIYRQIFAAILQLYFLFSTFLCILLFGFPICIWI